jgi:hypothetical protein
MTERDCAARRHSNPNIEIPNPKQTCPSYFTACVLLLALSRAITGAEQNGPRLLARPVCVSSERVAKLFAFASGRLFLATGTLVTHVAALVSATSCGRVAATGRRRCFATAATGERDHTHCQQYHQKSKLLHRKIPSVIWKKTLVAMWLARAKYMFLPL